MEQITNTAVSDGQTDTDVAAIPANLKLKRNYSMEKLGENWILATMEVSRTETVAGKNTRVKVGEVKVPVATLAAFGITAALDTETPVGDDGIPCYADSKHNFAQDAIRAAHFVIARNRLIPNTTDLQQGKSFPANFEELAQRAESGNAEALKIRHEAVAAFAAFIASQGKSQQVVDTWKKLFRDAASMAVQSDAMKEKAKVYLSGFAESLSPEHIARYGSAILAAEEACKQAAPTMDDY